MVEPVNESFTVGGRSWSEVFFLQPGQYKSINGLDFLRCQGNLWFCDWLKGPVCFGIDQSRFETRLCPDGQTGMQHDKKSRDELMLE